jgi:phospholipid/cholesterol/gamma-HCH transport system substrate-binding protein
MRSRTMREGTLGLFILLGIGIFTGIALWLRGLNPANRTFKVFFEFGDTAGLQIGAPVRYRGVTIGKIVNIRPLPNKVEVEAALGPADLIIPKDVVAEVNQSGLISQTAIQLRPLRQLASTEVAAKPLDAKCDNTVILCNNTRLPGEAGVSTDELIRATVRFANLYTDPQFFANVNSVVKNTSDAAAEATKLAKEFTLLTQTARKELGSFTASANAITQTANKLGTTADQVNGLIASNRSTLVSTLDNLSQTSVQLRSTVGSFDAVMGRVEQGRLIQNLETLSANAAQASANLKAASDSLSNPATILALQQTLDSARSTFQNAQKITADLDELTGDPKFRDSLKNLVNGLGNLVSSTQQLQQQTQSAQMLAPLSVSINQAAQEAAAASIAAQTQQTQMQSSSMGQARSPLSPEASPTPIPNPVENRRLNPAVAEPER